MTLWHACFAALCLALVVGTAPVQAAWFKNSERLVENLTDPMVVVAKELIAAARLGDADGLEHIQSVLNQLPSDMSFPGVLNVSRSRTPPLFDNRIVRCDATPTRDAPRVWQGMGMACLSVCLDVCCACCLYGCRGF